MIFVPRAPGRLFSASLLLIFVLGELSQPGIAAAEEGRRPNILLAIADYQSDPYASIYGDTSSNTPAFDRIAREGVLFRNGFAASPGCSPSRAALLTGRHTWQMEHAGTHASSFSQRYDVYPDLLEDAGYFVGYTGKGWSPGNWQTAGRTRNPAGPQYSQQKMKSPQGISNTDYAANFATFLKERPADAPFCFWYGATEPHRSYKKGIGEEHGKKLADAQVPGFLPDKPEIRSDILDYSFEIEWFDQHLGRMLATLEEQGLLENTLIVVTADNGMPFPRAKANCYESGIHVPLAVRWGAQVPAGRTVDDLVGFVDLAPTFLEAAGLKPHSEMTGRSLLGLLTSEKSGLVDPTRTAIFAARERHSSSRWNNLAYPMRVIRTHDFLYIRNFRPDRWPAGAPQKFESDGSLGPLHGGYHDIDACPSLTFLIEHRDDPDISGYFHWAVDKRPAEELFDVRRDPANVNNLADDPKYADVASRLRSLLEDELRRTSDPRLLDGGDIFESYQRFSSIRKFPKPE